MTGARTRFQRRRGCGFTGAVGGAGAALPLSRPAARRSFLVLLPERAAAAPKPLLGPPRGGVRGARVGSSSSAARRLGVCVPRGPAPGSRLPAGRPRLSCRGAAPREPPPSGRTTRARSEGRRRRRGLGSARLSCRAPPPPSRRSGRARAAGEGAWPLRLRRRRLAEDPGAVNGFCWLPVFPSRRTLGVPPSLFIFSSCYCDLMALVIRAHREVQPLIVIKTPPKPTFEAAVNGVFPSLIERRGKCQPFHPHPSDPSAVVQE